MDLTQIEQAITDLDIPAGKVRISAAHLVPSLTNADTGISANIGILNKPGKYQALGGAINLTGLGAERARSQFNASDLEPDEKSGRYDARFMVPSAASARAALLWFANFLAPEAPHLFETTPLREVSGELKESKADLGSVIPEATPEAHFKARYLGVAIQPAPLGEDTSDRAGAIPSRRMAHQWQLHVPNDLYQHITQSKRIRVLTDAELASTNGGSTAGQTHDGHTVANNLGLTTIAP